MLSHSLWPLVVVIGNSIFLSLSMTFFFFFRIFHSTHFYTPLRTLNVKFLCVFFFSFLFLFHRLLQYLPSMWLVHFTNKMYSIGMKWKRQETRAKKYKRKLKIKYNDSMPFNAIFCVYTIELRLRLSTCTSIQIKYGMNVNKLNMERMNLKIETKIRREVEVRK